MRIIVLATMVAAAGCAAQPKDAPPASAAESTAALTSAAATPAAAEASSEFRPPAGYKLQAHRGENVYCKEIVVLGSRFPKEDCRTEAELRYLETQKDIARIDIQQKIDVCSGGAACTSR